jgi:pimeloyl-ACP methyl ester carboxylesterase
LRDEAHYGYSTQQSTRPQTLGYGLADSPVGQAAWIYEKLSSWSQHDSNGDIVFSKDEILDTITLYWFSNAGTSSARYYWECEFDSTGWSIGKEVPVGVSWFPGDTAFGPKEWCERYYQRLVHWRAVERGGHFAAWEVPELFLREVREWRGKIGL